MQESLFYTCMCGHFKQTILLFEDSFYSEQIRISYFTSHFVVLEHLNPNFFLKVVFPGRWVIFTPLHPIRISRKTNLISI